MVRRPGRSDPVVVNLEMADVDAGLESIFFGQYERIGSFFHGLDLASTGLPEGQELAILESVRDKVPPSVFTTPYKNPVNDSPEAIRSNLREADRLLKEAGWEVRDGALLFEISEIVLHPDAWLDTPNDRLGGQPPRALLGFEEGPGQALRARSSDRVIYLGSCSKMFGAGLRTGWVLAPPAVREKLVLVNESQVLSPAMLTQMIASEYLGKYPWREQLKVFREIYRERRDVMLDALSTHMPTGVTWTHPRGGFFVWATVGDELDTKAMQPRALAHKVAYVPGIGFYADGSGRQNMRLCFSSASPDRIREGIRRLASVVEEETELRQVFNTPSAVRRGPHGGPVSRTSFAPGPELA